jgi:hypothetical protein
LAKFLVKPSVFATFSLPYREKYDPIRAEKSLSYTLTRARRGLGRDLRGFGVWGIGRETKKVHCHMILTVRDAPKAHRMLGDEWERTLARHYKETEKREQVYWSDNLVSLEGAFRYCINHDIKSTYIYG